MRRLTLSVSCLVLALFTTDSAARRAQEGRPALAVETAEDARVKRVIHDALPHDMPGWTVDRESETDGVRSFHSSGDAATSPFTHEYQIRYVYKPTPAEAARWKALATDTEGIQQMLDETECEIAVFVNGFSHDVASSAALDARTRAPFSIALYGRHGARLFLGPWKIARQSESDGRFNYALQASSARSARASLIQTVTIAFKGSPRVVDLFLAKMDTASLARLIGEDRMAAPASSPGAGAEKPLPALLPGNNEISFTLDGGDLHNATIRLKPSVKGEFAYLRNNHPDRAITENAVTRLLGQEDDDFTTKLKTGFLDMTIPLIRQTGRFDVTPTSTKASLAGGVNCWDGCEWAFDAKDVQVEITRYDPVNGFIEGTFAGTVTLKYRPHLPTTNRVETGRLTNGHFKVHRQADRY